MIIQQDNFTETVHTGLKASAEGRIATIGIKPIRPDTGYGYIEFDSSKGSQPNDVIAVDQFREKPDYNTAKSFLEQGNFLWNAGIFMWSVKSVISAFKNNPYTKSLNSSV